MFIGACLGYNNAKTPELVSMCKINEKVDLFVPEEIIHFVGFLFFVGVLKRYSIDKTEKLEESEKIDKIEKLQKSTKIEIIMV